MEDGEFWWAPAIGAAAVITILGVLALVALGGWTWFATFLTSGAADWAQAIFSAVAILAAYGMGSAQIRASDMAARKEEAKRLKTIQALFENAARSCAHFERNWRRRGGIPPQAFKVEQWVHARDAIARIDPFLCPSPSVIPYLVEAPRRLDELIELYADFSLAFLDSRTAAQKRIFLNEAIARLENELHAFLRYLEEAINACGKGIAGRV